MKATLFKGKGKVELGERQDPKIQEPTDAIVRVVRSCVCGSDLWYYRGVSPHESEVIGHELIGVIEKVAMKLRTSKLVTLSLPRLDSMMGHAQTAKLGFNPTVPMAQPFSGGTDGGQGEFVRSPYADATLVKVPGSEFTEDQLASFTALSDVMCTGHHAAISAGVKSRRYCSCRR
jgi:threonine dehydrogenase-like Zn-dependent dehydrogenase